MSDDKPRCGWGRAPDIMRHYHDTEWGVPLFDDRRLFEFLVLETFQAGLSWLVVLNKREGFREAMAGFDPEVVARYDEGDIDRLVQNPSIIRNRRKLVAASINARAFLRVIEEFGSFHDYIWRFTDGAPIVNHHAAMTDIPGYTPLAETVSRDLKTQGFSFVGPTVVYAHMQATGMVNDHLVSCFRHAEVGRAPM